MQAPGPQELPPLRESLLSIARSLTILVLVIGGLVLLLRYANLATLQGYIASAGWWAPALLVAAKATTIIVAPLGGAPLYPLAGALFGFWHGLVYLVAGDALGGAVSFYISRYFGRRVVQYFFPDSVLLTRILRTLSSVRGLLIARIGFLTFPEAVSYAAGLSTIRFVPFFIIYTVVGLVPTILTVWLGSLATQYNSTLIFVGTLVGGMALLGGGAALFWRHLEPAQ